MDPSAMGSETAGVGITLSKKIGVAVVVVGVLFFPGRVK